MISFKYPGQEQVLISSKKTCIKKIVKTCIEKKAMWKIHNIKKYNFSFKKNVLTVTIGF